MNVLIIESVPLYQHVLRQIVSDAGGTVQFTLTGADALRILSETKFDLVCVSHALQDMASTEFVRRVGAEVSDKVAVVLLTSIEDETLRRTSIDAGFCSILVKSDVEALQRDLQRLVGRGTAGLHGRVLLIEDAAFGEEKTGDWLQELGLEFDRHCDCTSAVNALVDGKYDLVITDVMAADKLTGVAVVNAVRESASHGERVPILVLSGSGDRARRTELLRHGASDFIRKPVEEEEFAARVRTLVTSKHLADQVQRQQDELFRLATTDQLTGLYNRHSLTEFAPKYLSEAYRHRYPLSLLVIDLDNFRVINESYGHVMGDQLIADVGVLLQAFFRREDIISRFGGEDFVILMPHCSQHDAERRAENLRRRVAELKPQGLSITASIGLTSLPLDVKVGFDRLISTADRALADAKKNGRNQVRVRLVAKAQ